MARSNKKSQHPICRAVKWVSKAQPTQDGPGVSLFRAIGQPALRELDPFLLLDEMHHRDSQGNEGVVGSGGVQWMRAARGIVHSEIPAQSDGLLWGNQLWVNLPAAHKIDTPGYRDIPAEAMPTVALNDGGFIRVIAGIGIADSAGPVVRDDIESVFLDIILVPHARPKQTRCGSCGVGLRC